MKVVVLALCFLAIIGTSSAFKTVFSEICTLLDHINADIKAALEALGQSLQETVYPNLVPQFLEALAGPTAILIDLSEQNVTGAYDILMEYIGKVFVFYEAITTAFNNESLQIIFRNLEQKIDEEFPGQLTSYCTANLSNVYQNESFEECYRKYEQVLIETSQKASDSVIALINGSLRVLENVLAPLFTEVTALANVFSEKLDAECGSNETCIVQTFVESEDFVIGNLSVFVNDSIAMGLAIFTDHISDEIVVKGNGTLSTILCNIEFCLSEA